jgi:hypothetical protein
MSSLSNELDARSLIAALPCEVNVPEDWSDYFSRTGPVPSGPGEQRRHPRFYFRTQVGFNDSGTIYDRPVQFSQAVVVKDVSRSGMAFLHRTPIDSGKRVQVLLPDGSIRGLEIQRCEQVNADCWSIGAEFVQKAPA